MVSQVRSQPHWYRRILLIGGLALATLAVIALWLMVAGDREDRRCRRYLSALTAALADPRSTTDIRGLSGSDSEAIGSSRDAFQDAYSHPLSISPTPESYNQTDAESARRRKILENGWNQWAAKFEKQAYARQDCG